MRFPRPRAAASRAAWSSRARMDRAIRQVRVPALPHGRGARATWYRRREAPPTAACGTPRRRWPVAESAGRTSGVPRKPVLIPPFALAARRARSSPTSPHVPLAGAMRRAIATAQPVWVERAWVRPSSPGARGDAVGEVPHPGRRGCGGRPSDVLGVGRELGAPREVGIGQEPGGRSWSSRAGRPEHPDVEPVAELQGRARAGHRLPIRRDSAAIQRA